jgi:hypothetical protein
MVKHQDFNLKKARTPKINRDIFPGQDSPKCTRWGYHYYTSFNIQHLLFVICYSLFVICYLLFVIFYSLFVIRYYYYYR